MPSMMYYTGLNLDVSCPKCGQAMIVETAFVKPIKPDTGERYKTSIERPVETNCPICGIKVEYGYDVKEEEP